MKLSSPFIITSRLLPGVKLSNEDTISIGSSRQLCLNGRYRYRYFIDTQTFEHTDNVISSPRYNLQEALSTLLSFLSAASEAYQSTLTGRYSDNADLFPQNVMEWAYQNSDEISMLDLYLKANSHLITE